MRWLLVLGITLSFVSAYMIEEDMAARIRKPAPKPDWSAAPLFVAKDPEPVKEEKPVPAWKKVKRVSRRPWVAAESMEGYEDNPSYNASNEYGMQGIRAQINTSRPIELSRVYVISPGLKFNINQPAINNDPIADRRTPVFTVKGIYLSDMDTFYLCGGNHKARVQLKDLDSPWPIIFDGEVTGIKPCLPTTVNCGGPIETWHEYCYRH